MKRTILATFACLCAAAEISAQAAPLRITLEVVAPALPDSIAIYATGSHPALGNWNPAGLKLASQGNHTWRGSFTIDRAMSLEYKFTLGIWEREAADSTGAPFRNIVARVTSDTLLRTRVGNWTSGPRPRVLDGQVTGALRFHRAVSGSGLAARDIVVWLPPGYDAEPTRRYPVLYMFDGQNLFDPATSSMGVDWAIDEAADSLIRAGTIPPLIIVGMNSTIDRTVEYLPLAKAAAHMDFVVRTVKPMIDGAYRTQRDAASTYVGGASAGGIAAFMLVWEHPEVFSRALAFSPAFRNPQAMTMRFDYVPTITSRAPLPRGVRFYFDMGGVGLDAELQPGLDAALGALRAHGYRDGQELRSVIDPAAEHNELAWRRRFPAALIWMLR